MPKLTILAAVNDALRTAMREDERVVVFGEDVGKKGGVFGATDKLQQEFGEGRCFDTPLSEDGIVGTAIGMGLTWGLTRLAQGRGGVFDSPGWEAFAVPLVLMAIVAAAGTLIPIRRALAIQPTVLLRAT